MEDMAYRDNMTNASIVYEDRNATGSTYEFYQTEQLVFLCLLFVMIVIGNSLVLIAIITSGKRRSRMNFFIINLACADLLVGFVFVLTDIIWKVTITWYAGNVGCKLIKFFQCYVTYGATYALVALSIDRFDAIARPMHMTDVEKRCRLLVSFAWSFAALFSLPMLFLYEEKEVDGIPQCWIELPETWMWQLYLTLISLAVFIIPAIIIATCYIVIVVIIWSKSSMKFNRCDEKSQCIASKGRLSLRVRGNTSHDMSATSSRGVIPKAKIKTIKMTFVIVLAFVFCWSPYFIWDLLSVYGHIAISPETMALSTFIQSLAPLNSAANPVIYTLFNTALCKRIFKKHNTYSSPGNSNANTNL